MIRVHVILLMSARCLCLCCLRGYSSSLKYIVSFIFLKSPQIVLIIIDLSLMVQNGHFCRYHPVEEIWEGCSDAVSY